MQPWIENFLMYIFSHTQHTWQTDGQLYRVFGAWYRPNLSCLHCMYRRVFFSIGSLIVLFFFFKSSWFFREYVYLYLLIFDVQKMVTLIGPQWRRLVSGVKYLRLESWLSKIVIIYSIYFYYIIRLYKIYNNLLLMCCYEKNKLNKSWALLLV